MIEAFVITFSIIWTIGGSIVLLESMGNGWYDKIFKPWKRVLLLFLCGPIGWVGVAWIFIIWILRVTRIRKLFVGFFTS